MTTTEPIHDAPTVNIEWRGEILTIPATLDDVDIAAAEAFERGRALEAGRGIIGAKRWEKLKRDGKLVTARDAGELLDMVAVAMGFSSAGE